MANRRRHPPARDGKLFAPLFDGRRAPSGPHEPGSNRANCTIRICAVFGLLTRSGSPGLVRAVQGRG
jgi:hypothetical protein